MAEVRAAETDEPVEDKIEDEEIGTAADTDTSTETEDADSDSTASDQAADPEVPDDPAADDPAADAGAAGASRGSRRRLAWRIGGLLAAFALGICAIVTWQAINHDNEVVNQVAGTQTSQDPNNTSLVRFTDSETRLRVDFPASWTTRSAGGADVRLVAGPGNGDLMSIRVVSLDTGTASPPTATSLKPYLDTIVTEPGVTIVQENQITLAQLPGWYYVYTFTDTTSDAQGVHAQYFVIRGTELYSIVFQALPESDFTKLAPTYQQVANSVQFY